MRVGKYKHNLTIGGFLCIHSIYKTYNITSKTTECQRTPRLDLISSFPPTWSLIKFRSSATINIAKSLIETALK